METKTWAKRIAALSTGALMLGATLMGAMAASDLGTYPAPFVVDGRLSDTVLVVGAAADTADVLGAVDIAAGLQAAAKTPAGTGTATAPTTDEGVKVEKSGDKFNYGDDVYDVMPEALDDNDLPDLLTAGTFEDDEGDNTGDEDYTQELQFVTGNADFDLYAPDDMEGGNYLRIEDGDALYTYTLEFDDSVSYDTTGADDDLTGTKIDIMGKTYTITDADVDGSGNLDMLTLTSGDSTVWLTQDHPLEFGGDTITVVDVGNDGTKCGVDVNGHVEWINEGSTSSKFPSDLSVGVLEVVETASEGENACELSLGSAELVFEEGQEVSVNDEVVDGSDVTFTVPAAGSWDGFVVSYTVDVDVDTDDVYLAEGDAWTDPVFGSWKVEYAGTTQDFEEMHWKSSGDDATLTFTNKDGQEVEVAWRYDGTNIGFGFDDDEPLLLPGQNATAHTLSTTDPEKVRLLYTTAGGVAHVLRLDSVDCTDSTRNETVFVDETYSDKRYTEEVVCDNVEHSVTIGSLGSVNLTLTSTFVEFNNDGGGDIESEYEGVFLFDDNYWHFTENAGDEQSAEVVFLNMSYDTADDEIEFDQLSNDIGGAAWSGVEAEEGDDDVKYAVTPKGTWMEYDNDEKLSVDVMAPEEDVFANVFVTPLGAKVTSGGASGDAYNVNAFEVGLAVLDTDAEGMNKNMIVVGGPCANTLAAEVMESGDDCAAGFEEGKAMVKYFDRNGKAVLLVAGYSARDTRGASYVLADYGSYDLSGDEVEVVSTNLNDLKVNTV